MASIPSDFKFVAKTRLDDLASDLAHAGKLDWVKTRTTIDPKQREQFKELILRSFQMIELKHAFEGTSDKSLVNGKTFDPSVYFIGALWSIRDHHLFGGGGNDVVTAEKAAVERRPPPPLRPSLQNALDGWVRSIRKAPEEWRQATGWQNFASLMMTLDQQDLAIDGLRHAVSFRGRQVFQYQWLHQIVRYGRTSMAVQAVENVEITPNRKIKYLAKLARFTAEQGDLEVSRKLVRSARLMVPLIKSSISNDEDVVDAALDLVPALMILGDRSEAREIADQILSIARKTYALKPFRLLKAAHAYYDVGDNKRALGIVRAALGNLPPEDQIVAIGFYFGPISFSGGIKSAFSAEAAKWLCKLGQIDQSTELAKEIKDNFHKLNAARSLYECMLDSVGYDISPEHLAMALGLKSPHAIYLKAASKHIIEGDAIGAARALRQVLSIKAPKEPTRFNYFASMLRMSVAIRDHRLTREILTGLLEASKEARAEIEVARILARAAAIVRKQF